MIESKFIALDKDGEETNDFEFLIRYSMLA